jgi:hypothetical protein
VRPHADVCESLAKFKQRPEFLDDAGAHTVARVWVVERVHGTRSVAVEHVAPQLAVLLLLVAAGGGWHQVFLFTVGIV